MNKVATTVCETCGGLGFLTKPKTVKMFDTPKIVSTYSKRRGRRKNRSISVLNKK